MKKILFAVLFSLLASPVFAACPNPLTVKDASGTTQNMSTSQDVSTNCEGNVAGLSGSFVDGWNATEGAKSDAAWTSGSGSVIAILKNIANSLASVASSLSGPTPAGTNTIGNIVDYFNVNNANTQPHICGNHVFKHITTATDTQIVAASGATNIFVCDYSISFNGTGNIYLEKATSGTCGTLTQIDQVWYGIANAGKAGTKAFYTGLNTGTSAQLCANTSASVAIDISVDYDQY